MDKKIFIGVGIVAICAVLLVCFLGGDGIFHSKTSFKTKFMDGEIQGNAFKEPDLISDILQDYRVDYSDHSNNVFYTFGVVKNASFSYKTWEWFGAKKIHSYEVNGITWTIYYQDSKTISKYHNATTKLGGYLCVAYKDGIYYEIGISSDKIPSNSSIDSELFKNYAKPLIESVTLKNASKAPYLYQWWGYSEGDFNMLVNDVNNNGFDYVYPK
ncbi:MAG: hypothetical protein FWH54_01280 [Methanobrevibacter sp.]|nr:hypothetical protein [Methanobrevibacter sp.]